MILEIADKLLKYAYTSRYSDFACHLESDQLVPFTKMDLFYPSMDKYSHAQCGMISLNRSQTSAAGPSEFGNG